MKMTNAQMEKSVEVLNQLDEKGQLGYAIARNLRKLKDESEEYVTLKNQLLAKYGQVQGDKIVISGEALDRYREEMGNVPNDEFEVDVYRVSEDVFLSGNLTSKQMESLLWMVE